MKKTYMVPKMEQEMIEDVLPLCVSGGIKGCSGVGGGGFGGIDTGGLKDPSAPGREDFGDELNELLW